MQHLKTISIADEPDPVDVEAERLDALHSLDILDSPREEEFDRLVSLVRNIFDVPIALVSVMDAHRQWYKAIEGLDACEAPRKDTFCRRVIDDPKPLVVPDALLDARFAANPFVTGKPFVRFYAGAPLVTSDGHVVGTICALDIKPRSFSAAQMEILTDLAFLVSHAIQLRALATTDMLTGLMSRRAFKESGTRAFLQAERHHQPLSCVAMDIDHFKTVNDQYGHGAGDTVLAATAAACLSAVQRSDMFGRLGGEEFALLLPKTDRRGAMIVAERLRMEIERQNFVLGGGSRKITASFGVAEIDPATRDLDTLIANADNALYQAKAEGRNRTVCWMSKSDVVDLGARRRVLKSGRILFNNRNSTVDCSIRSLGEQGAGMDVCSILGIPDRFLLAIPADRIERTCRVVAYSERHLDVEFC